MSRAVVALATWILITAVLVPTALACDAYDGLIRQAADRYRVPWWLVKGLIAAESGFWAGALRAEPHIGDAGHGLMQILLSTARDMGYRGGSEGLLDPATNIDLGTRYFSQMVSQFRDVRLAVAAYNAGPGYVGRLAARYGMSYDAVRPHLPAAVQEHVRRVLAYGTAFRDGTEPAFAFRCPAEPVPVRSETSPALLFLLFIAALVVLADS
ncbi:MAG: transglycosylase SLT domain-containing protein [Firmicutes bacterium]|nr:transglycosylase SLT domain-containing protein [Bacillota bacterium]